MNIKDNFIVLHPTVGIGCFDWAWRNGAFRVVRWIESNFHICLDQCSAAGRGDVELQIFIVATRR